MLGQHQNLRAGARDKIGKIFNRNELISTGATRFAQGS